MTILKKNSNNFMENNIEHSNFVKKGVIASENAGGDTIKTASDELVVAAKPCCGSKPTGCCQGKQAPTEVKPEGYNNVP